MFPVGLSLRRFPAWRAGASAALAAALLLFSVPAVAQTPAAGSARLDAIAIAGSRFPSDQIAAAIGLRSGANVTRDDLQSAADRLAKLGLFATVQYRFRTEDTGVRVDYQVSDAPAVPVYFDNFPWFSDEELSAAIKSSVFLFDGAAPAQGAILDEMSDALAKVLNARGVHGAVLHALVTLPSSGARVQEFRVEGATPKVGSVEFSDTLANSDRGIQERLADIVGKPFSREAMETFEYEQVRPVYLAHGLLHVRFGAVAPRLEGGVKSDLPNQVNVVAAIEPGPAYAWNGISWSGNTAMGVAELNALVTLQPGQAADGNKIEGMWQALRDAYCKQGFLDANVNAAPQFDEFGKRVTFAASVTEGPQYRMGQLLLTGLSVDGERRVRGAWKIPAGTIFDKSIYEAFLESGIKQAFAGTSLRYEKIGRFLQQDAQSGKVDVLLDFQ